jgi:phosphate/sulfate permease
MEHKMAENSNLKNESIGTGAAGGAAIGAAIATTIVSSTVFSPLVGAAVGAGLGSWIGRSIYQHQTHESEAAAPDTSHAA